MTSQIEKTNLWATSLGAKDSDQEIERKKELLRSVLRRFREHVSVLTSRIIATFPQLTVHDVTHLDALWETADLIAGENYPFNPLEAFVFGGAILLHDAAHCFEAYEGGREAVRSTVAWKDALASEISANPDEPREKLEQYCDFTAIRLLHARQAEKLGEHEWKNEYGGPSFFLIEDTDLRSRYGALIGQIAASHNWSIDDVKTRLRAQVNAPGGWPGEWRVDPIKIACLLRCADAVHLDERRAPDFLLALVRRSGVSFDHWKAQNWLARVDLDQSDPTKSSLLFTSTHAFRSSDSNSWWVAYDAIAMLDAEIRASNNLLLSRVQRDSSSPAFKMQRVTGANSPTELSRSVETEGWIPTSAKIHVGNLERLVETLGGQNLYGTSDNFAIAMRELIQNARDAVTARGSLARGFTGRILVRVTSKSNTQTVVEVRDDGVGMSERTMTGALLDFGTSFWASDLVRSEFPGLRSSSFSPVGKFGIGFYAVFMIASEVLVASRRFDEGLSDVTRLHFPKGLTLRPILAKGADENYDVMSSTIVRVTIDEPIDDIKNRWINRGDAQNEWRVPLQNYLAAITTALDVPVTLQVENEGPIAVHESIDSLDAPEKLLDWIKGISFVDVPLVKGGANLGKYIQENAQRMRRIEDDGRLVGLAALLDVNNGVFQHLTTDTIGGLTNNIMRGAAGYMGYMEHYPASAKRDAVKKLAPIEVLQSWANEQVSIIRARNATQEQLYWAASNMSNLELDPVDVVNFPVLIPNGQYTLLTFDQIFNVLQQTAISCLKSRQTEFAETNVQPIIIEGLPTLRPLSGGNLIRLNIENGKPTYPRSLLGCLDRLTMRRGGELSYEVKPLPFTTIFGVMDALIIKLRNG